MEWFDIRDPNDPKLDELAARFGLHPLHIEDCRHRNQSAKIESQNEYLFIVLKPSELGEEYCLVSGDLDIFLGADFIITVDETGRHSVQNVLDRLRLPAKSLRADQVFYRIADALVDSYNPLLDSLSEQIETLEDEALRSPEPELIERLFDIRRALLELRRIMANSRDLVGHLLRTEYPQVSRDLMPFLRDVYDHIARNLDIIEVQRELVTGATELYLSSVANRTNQVMKVLTVFGTIATPAVVITGLYGMNLQHLPFAERDHSWGIVIGMIAGASAFMLFVLRKLHWF